VVTSRLLEAFLACPVKCHLLSNAVDERQDYGEMRYIAIGMLGVRLHVLCFAETADGIRVISFRKANAREVRRYAKAQATE
jgi:uncharacterized DUF497 family protein